MSRFGRIVIFHPQHLLQATSLGLCRYSLLWTNPFSLLTRRVNNRDFPGPVGFSGELSSEHLWWVLFAVCLQVVSPASVGGYFPLIVVKHRLRLNQLVFAGICRYFVLWDESFLDLHPTPSYRDFPESVGFESFCLNIFGLLLAVCFQVVSPASVGGYCPLLIL